MDMCRVCLSTEQGLHALDETFVLQYNLLTNLNITLLDGMPQFTCKTCLETVKYFIKFRESSIASEETLRDFYANVKLEEKHIAIELEAQHKIIPDECLKKDIKGEIKEENEIDSDTADNCDVTIEAYDGDVHNPVRNEDIKVKKVKKVNKRKNKVKARKAAPKRILKSTDDNSSWTCDIKVKKVKKVNKRKNRVKGQKAAPKKILKSNDDNSNWICGVCPKEFVEEGDLNKHLDVHKDDRQCKLCEEKVNSLSQLLAHRLAHVSQKQYKCHICSKLHKTCLYLEFHYRTVHIDTDAPTLTCKSCLSNYRTPRNMLGHMRTVHSTAKYICDFCSKGFNYKQNLKSHIQHHMANKAYACDLCEFSCNYVQGLKDHKVRKHAKKKINCKNCRRVFPSQEDFDKHKCQPKQCVCTICGLQLKGSSRLSSHMISHSDVFKYECDRCPAKYKSNTALKVHQDRHDGIRSKQCEYCPAKFYSASVLQKHRRIHTGEKPFVCKVCHRGFTGNHNLRVHMKVHGEYLIVKKNNDDINNLSNITK